MKLILRSLVAFYRDDGPLHAGSIAYFFLMSFAPFCLLLIAIFGYFLGDNKDFYEFFAARLIRFFPEATSEISMGLTAIVTYRKIGILTVIVYAFFSYLLYSSLETAVHVIFQEKAKRSRLVSVIMSFVMISFIAGFIIVSFAATSAIEILKLAIMDTTGLQIGILTSFLIRFLIPVLLVFIVVTTLYKFLPVRKTTLRSAFGGGLFTAILLEGARHLFTFYVVKTAAQFGAIYGSLSSLVIFLMWIFYAACIFLVGAEMVEMLDASKRRA